jgi:NAD(P)-dependent dehydrogenase (short-subunit alcohol dehydrogenase family)
MSRFRILNPQPFITRFRQPLTMSARPRNLPLHANAENCTGRTFIVTGANSGLGYEVTKHLVGAGASKVIMAVRNTDSGKAAKSQIAAELGHEGIAAEVWPIDLASYASVKAFAKRATEELSRIDALIENAGVFDFKRIMAEGHLSTVTVNILSPFLLALLLLPKLKETAENSILPPHIVFVGSSYGFKNEQEWNLVKDDPLAKMDANGLAEVPVDTHQT